MKKTFFPESADPGTGRSDRRGTGLQQRSDRPFTSNRHPSELDMNKTTTATTVGLFLMIGFACTAYLTLTLSNTNVLKHNFYQLTAKFTTVSGVAGRE